MRRDEATYKELVVRKRARAGGHGTFQLPRRLLAAVNLVVAGCVGGPFTAEAVRAAERRPAQVPMVDPATLDPKIPTPDSIIGHAIGDQAVRYEPMVRYLRAIDEASPVVQLTPYATSHEGRTLFYLTISNEKNLARLGEIKAANAKLADPRKLSGDDEARRIIDSLPGIAWMAYSIHGDELSSTDAAVQLAYQLAAGKDNATRVFREELVIHVDPLMNPDGRERHLSALQPLSGRVPNSDVQAMSHTGLWAAGRGNHYLFDMNRDWLMQAHPETRGRAAKILEWNPHLVVDSHEMGSLDTYLFDPPREPLNLNLSDSVMNWRRRFSVDQAKAFDRFGWSYYTKEWYEEWYPGYTNAWTSLLGAIGILYEQASVDGSAVKQESGHTLTYREAVHHHLVSSLANLESLRANRKAILTDYLAEKRRAVGADNAAGEALLVPPPSDGALLTRFTDLLNRHGIEFGFSPAPFQANVVVDLWGRRTDRKSMPEGTLVVRGAQPHRRLIHALLDFDPHMSDAFLLDERKDLENRRGTRVYDITAWNLGMAFGLDAHWAANVDEVTLRKPQARTGARLTEKPGYGYLIDGASADVYRLLARLLPLECKARVAIEPFAINGKEYEPGSLLIRVHENADDVLQQVNAAADGLEVEIRGTNTALCEKGPDLGGKKFALLQSPRIALATQWPISTTSFGSLWYLLDERLGLRVSPINIQTIAMMDLRKYNLLVLPDSWSVEALGAILDENTRKKVRAWIEGGGTLIAVGGSAAFLCDKDKGLSTVRLRQDVLDQLPAYEESLKRERSARSVQVDAAAVWGPATPKPLENNAATSTPAPPSEPAATPSGVKPATPPDVEALKREDVWLRNFSPGGAIVAATLNLEHWLCFGLPPDGPGADRLPVLLGGPHAFYSKEPVETPVRLVGKDNLRLSGLLWPEARQRWGDTPYATVEKLGNGQIILFATDPFFRGYFESTGRMFLNAVLLGPGLGATQAVPW